MKLFLVLALIFSSGFLFYVVLKEPAKIEIIVPVISALKLPEIAAPVLVDIENQKPLANPPQIIKAIYLTGWSAGNPTKIKYLLNLATTTEINAVVIDIKDYSGYVGYNIKVPEVEKYKAKEIRISQINRLIKQLHDAGIYVIARITIFQDPRLALARPDLTVKSKKTGNSWQDKKGLSWIDPAAEEAWNYNIAIAKEASQRGFDELNFDYIRFPSDGDLNDMVFPFWDEKISKSSVLKSFFKTLRQQLTGTKISADLFGLATINQDDLGIGQVIENAYEYFDYVYPMVYPSHYAAGFIGYQNPALYPYEVIKYSLDSAVKRLTASSTAFSAGLRPWLQDFDMGAVYNAEMVRKEIQATVDALGEKFSGWLLWNPENVYSL
jgi:hypothetical protein